jgi:bacterioferritin (cytochrome b1)
MGNEEKIIALLERIATATEETRDEVHRVRTFLENIKRQQEEGILQMQQSLRRPTLY